ncbi:MAG: YggS family pyridoxal phosphate-dependent enzyme [Acidobacteriales bacterium]|nr:YggS family pyridoxal phosphate-dependent enzyme [Terriglobales bacterium]
MSIAENLKQVRERIELAARHAGRDSASVELMAVTKTQPAERIREAYEAGQRLFGENRVQEFAGKAEALRDLSGAEWRLIGHLQSNKASKAAELFAGVDSVDSVRLAEKLDAAAQTAGKTLNVLIEVNVGGEAAKAGVAPQAAELERLLEGMAKLSSLKVRGLMTVPPFAADPEESRSHFRSLRELRDEVAGRLTGVSLTTLSMGMSHDCEVAIEEGSTCVRVGTAIFGERQK